MLALNLLRKEPKALRVHRHRFTPTVTREERLFWTLNLLREFCNACLQERRDAYRERKRLEANGVDAKTLRELRPELFVDRATQSAALVEIKKLRPEYKQIHAQVLQDVVRRVDLAFQAFFRRLAAGETPGYPRFKGRDRYRSFTYPQPREQGVKFCSGGKRLKLSGIGTIRVKFHRPARGELRKVSVVHASDGHWYVDLTYLGNAQHLPATGHIAGSDAGITDFAVVSSGPLADPEGRTCRTIDNPRFLKKGARRLRGAARRLSRRPTHSRGREEAKALLGKQHSKIARQRLDFHHKEALKMVRGNDVIVVEAGLEGLAKGMLAKHVLDAGWGQYFRLLAYKAESAGRELVRVRASDTTVDCSRCGAPDPKTLADRVHECTRCGLRIPRDRNSGREIRRRGMEALGLAGARQSVLGAHSSHCRDAWGPCQRSRNFARAEESE